MKITKDEAKYKQGTDNRRCALCTMFRASNGCTAVAGHIYRDGVCKLFERKK